MSKLTFQEYLKRVMDDPHEDEEAKEAIREWLESNNANIERQLKREAYWGTYCEQQYNAFKIELEKAKSRAEAEMLMANIRSLICFAFAVLALGVKWC